MIQLKYSIPIMALAVSGILSADTVSYEQSFSVSTTLGGGPTTSAQPAASGSAFTTVNLPQFNLLNAVLNSITIQVLSPLSGDLGSQTVTLVGQRNSSSGNRTFTLNGNTSSGTLTVANMSGSPLNVFNLSTDVTCLLGSGGANPKVCGPTQSGVTSTGVANIAATQTFLNPGFIGNGTFAATLTLQATRGAISVPSLSTVTMAQLDAAFAGRVSVTYDYTRSSPPPPPAPTPTPEPASLGMMGLAVAGFSYARWRNRKS